MNRFIEARYFSCSVIRTDLLLFNAQPTTVEEEEAIKRTLRGLRKKTLTMRTRIQFALIVAATAVRLSAGSVNVDCTGVSWQTDSSGNLIAPYYATVNGVAETVYCDDYANDVYLGQQYTANLTNMGSGNLSETRYGGLTYTLQTATGSTTYSAIQVYEMVAYLTTQFGSNETTNGLVQDTIWNLFNPNPGNSNIAPPTLSSNFYLYAAESNYTLINPNNFYILTNTGTVALTGQIQELIFAPEPASMLLIGFGLIGVSLYGRRKLKFQPAQ